MSRSLLGDGSWNSIPVVAAVVTNHKFKCDVVVRVTIAFGYNGHIADDASWIDEVHINVAARNVNQFLFRDE